MLGAWCLVLGAWCLVLGAWCLVLGAWCLVLGAWCLSGSFRSLGCYDGRSPPTFWSAASSRSIALELAPQVISRSQTIPGELASANQTKRICPRQPYPEAPRTAITTPKLRRVAALYILSTVARRTRQTSFCPKLSYYLFSTAYAARMLHLEAVVRRPESHTQPTERSIRRGIPSRRH